MASTADRQHAGKRTSLRDVAELAGVSTATVSRVLSGSTHAVSPGTREAVLHAANELGFEPNRLARSLATAKSCIIGVIVHDVADPYFGEIVRGLEEGLARAGYQVLIASSDRDPDKEIQYIRALMAQQVDGIVLAASSIGTADYERSITDLIDRFVARGGSVVLLSDHVIVAPRVWYDNRGAATDLTQHLIAAGHTRIACLHGGLDLRTSRLRYQGYVDALQRAGLPVDEAIVADGTFTLEGGHCATGDLLRRSDFTALVALNDLMAIGAIRGMLDAGVQVPDQVAVAGFDDIAMAAYAAVPLTTMRLPTLELGAAGARLILAAMAGEPVDTVQVPGELVIRSSAPAV